MYRLGPGDNGLRQFFCNRQTHIQSDPGFSRQIASERSPELLVLVGFSGGGTRAAALAYGVLKTLADTEVTTEKGRTSLAA